MSPTLERLHNHAFPIPPSPTWPRLLCPRPFDTPMETELDRRHHTDDLLLHMVDLLACEHVAAFHIRQLPL